MADKTFYRYIDAHGDAHFVDLPGDVPKSYKGVVEQLTVTDNTATTAKAVGFAEEAFRTMHWSSFAWGLGLAAVLFLVMRLFALGRKVFIGIAIAVALGGFGAGFSMKDLKTHLPTSMANVLPVGVDLKQLPNPLEAKRILDNLPKASAERDKLLEQVLKGEK